MESKREQAIVGLFVLVAAAVLVATVFALTGAFAGAAVTYRAYFPFAGGLEPGATVRYAGGPKVGRVEKLQLDPTNPSRIEITFSVKPGIAGQNGLPCKDHELEPAGGQSSGTRSGKRKSRARRDGSDPAVRSLRGLQCAHGKDQRHRSPGAAAS